MQEEILDQVPIVNFQQQSHYQHLNPRALYIKSFHFLGDLTECVLAIIFRYLFQTLLELKKIGCFDLAHLTSPLTFFPIAIMKFVALVVLVQIFSSFALSLGFSAGNDVVLSHMTTLSRHNH